MTIEALNNSEMMNEFESTILDIQKETQKLSDQVQESIKQPSYDHKNGAINFPYHRNGVDYHLLIKPEGKDKITIESFKNGKQQSREKGLSVSSLSDFNTVIGGKLDILIKDPNRTKVSEKGNNAYKKLEALILAKEKKFKLNPSKNELELSVVHTVPVYNDFVVSISQTKDAYITKIKESKYDVFSTKFESKKLEESIQKASSYLINHVSPNTEAYKPLKEKTKVKMDDAKKVYEQLLLETSN